MSAPSLDKEFYKYWAMLTSVQKESLLSVVKSFIQADEKLEHISIEQYNKELEEAEKEIENGDFITQEELLKEIKKW